MKIFINKNEVDLTVELLKNLRISFSFLHGRRLSSPTKESALKNVSLHDLMVAVKNANIQPAEIKSFIKAFRKLENKGYSDGQINKEKFLIQIITKIKHIFAKITRDRLFNDLSLLVESKKQGLLEIESPYIKNKTVKPSNEPFQANTGFEEQEKSLEEKEKQISAPVPFKASVVERNQVIQERIKKEDEKNPKLPLENIPVKFEVQPNLPDNQWDDRDYVLQQVQKNAKLILHANKKFLDDKEIVLSVVRQKHHNNLLQYVSDRLKNDPDVIIAALDGFWSILHIAGEAVKDNEDVVLQAIMKHPSAIGFASPRLKNSKKVALEVVKRDGAFFRMLKDLKDDEEVALEALKNSPIVVKFVTERLLNDRKFLLKAMEANGLALAHLSDELKDDREFVLKSVSQNGLALKYASDKLKKDIEICQIAEKRKLEQPIVPEDNIVVPQVKNEPIEKEKHAEEISIPIKEQNPWDDRDYVLQQVQKDALLILQANKKFLDDKEIVLTLMDQKHHNHLLNYVSEGLKNDPEVVIKALNGNCLVFEFAGEKAKDNEEVALHAIERNPSHVRYISPRLKKSEKIALAVVKKDAYFFRYLKDLKYDKNFLLKALEIKGIILANLKDELRDDYDLVLKAVTQNGLALKYASDRLKKDAIICNTAYRQNADASAFALRIVDVD